MLPVTFGNSAGGAGVWELGGDKLRAKGLVPVR